MQKIYLEPTEIRQLEDSAMNLRDKLLVRVLFRLGCRISEVLPIEVDHISFQNGTITIKHLKYRIRIECPHCHAWLGRKEVLHVYK